MTSRNVDHIKIDGITNIFNGTHVFQKKPEMGFARILIEASINYNSEIEKDLC